MKWSEIKQKRRTDRDRQKSAKIGRKVVEERRNKKKRGGIFG